MKTFLKTLIAFGAAIIGGMILSYILVNNMTNILKCVGLL